MDGTRLRIVVLLQEKPEATVDDLARSLGLAGGTIRRHLDILQRDRQVAFHVVRRKPGRPQHAFYLTGDGQEAMPKRYPQLLQRMIWAMDASAPDSLGKDVEGLLSRIAARIAAPYAQRFQGKPAGERAAVLQEILEAEQFAPAMEMGPGALRMHLLNCPYRGVAMENAAVCALDQRLISLVLGVPVSNEERINRNHHHCIYSSRW
jgi:predicted ArsR family transcriptional regulator